LSSCARLLRALGAIAVVFIGLMFWPGPGHIYDLLAQPLTAALPRARR
jgi:sec-independent protein translocase protein TatC